MQHLAHFASGDLHEVSFLAFQGKAEIPFNEPGSLLAISVRGAYLC
jgi:hypothetical protein